MHWSRLRVQRSEVAADRKVRSKATSGRPSNVGLSHGFGSFSQVIVETTGTGTSGTAGGFIRTIGSVAISPSSVSHLNNCWRLRYLTAAVVGFRRSSVCGDERLDVVTGDAGDRRDAETVAHEGVKQASGVPIAAQGLGALVRSPKRSLPTGNEGSEAAVLSSLGQFGGQDACGLPRG